MARRHLEQAQRYHDERWAHLMGRALSRRFVLKAGTLAALGGTAALSQLIAACAGGASRTTVDTKEIEAGAFKYSRYPAIEKYNWRSLPWVQTPLVDGKFVRSGTGPNDWDFVRNYRSVAAGMMQQLLRLRYDPTSAPDFTYEVPYIEPDMADKITVAKDFSYYDYHIRPQIYFHDIAPVNGRLCTAEDVAYSLEVLRTVGFQTAALEPVQRFEVLPDKETVRAVMKQPINFLSQVLASPDYGIFAKEHFEDRQRFKDQLITTGPFMVTKSAVSGSITTVRHPRFNRPNPQYPGYQLPFLREVQYERIPDASAVKAAYRTAQIDMYNTNEATEFEDMLATNSDSIVQVSAPTATYNRIDLNWKNPLFKDVRIRRALNMAIDRQAMVNLLAGGLASPSHPISYHLIGRTDPLRWDELDQWHQHNPARAKQLLAEAGYPNGFEMEMMVSNAPTNFHTVTAEHLATIGVQVRFNQLESAVVNGHKVNKTFPDALGTTDSQRGYHGVRQALQAFLPDSPQNFGNVDDPKLTDLMFKAAYELDADRQLQLLKQINDYASDICFAIETFSAFQCLLYQPWTRNLTQSPTGWVTATGAWQYAQAYVTDRAPEGRQGRLKA